MTVLLEADHLSRRGAKGAVLLADISFRLHAGDRCVLTGPSGTGKSLFIRALAFLDPWDEGELRWRGNLVDAHSMFVPGLRAEVIYIPQRPVLGEGLVIDLLRNVFHLTSHKMKRYNETFIRDSLLRFGLKDSFLNRNSRELSGGEMQIVALLRALQLKPTVLLLDEPTSALDPQRVLVAEALVQEWISVGERAYIWITHEERQAARVAGKKLCMAASGLNYHPE